MKRRKCKFAPCLSWDIHLTPSDVGASGTQAFGLGLELYTSSFPWPSACIRQIMGLLRLQLYKPIPVINLSVCLSIVSCSISLENPDTTDRIELMNFVPSTSVLFHILGHHFVPRLLFIPKFLVVPKFLVWPF